MTIKTLPKHFNPMVEKAAEAICSRDGNDWPSLGQSYNGKVQQRIYRRQAEEGILAFLNACLEDGVAFNGRGMNEVGGDFPALILKLGEAK